MQKALHQDQPELSKTSGPLAKDIYWKPGTAAPSRMDSGELIITIKTIFRDPNLSADYDLNLIKHKNAIALSLDRVQEYRI